jgi:hypothetical protein
MTSKEFNEKYKDFLEPGFYGLAINIPELTEYLDKVFQEYTKNPSFQYSQIKSKFGYIRIYCSLGEGETRHLENKCQEILNNYVRHESKRFARGQQYAHGES